MGILRKIINLIIGKLTGTRRNPVLKENSKLIPEIISNKVQLLLIKSKGY